MSSDLSYDASLAEIEAYEASILENQKRLADVRANRAKFTEEELFAQDLHRVLCHANHDDQCGWLYEKGFGPNSTTHQDYLTRARKLLEFTDAETAIKTITTARGY